jgi:hypothetical protein
LKLLVDGQGLLVDCLLLLMRGFLCGKGVVQIGLRGGQIAFQFGDTP